MDQATRARAVARQGMGGLPDPAAPAETDPVARVLVDVALPHLDRPFEYSVPRTLADLARPGARVKVRFAGQDVGGYLLERAARPGQDRPLQPLRAVVSPEPVLTPSLHRLVRSVADRYAGSLADVLRLAVPPRHAAAERALPALPEAPATPPRHADEDWSAYPALPAFLARVAAGQAPAAALQALPAQPEAADWPSLLAAAATAAVAAGRGALLVVPDHRDVERVSAALAARLGPDGFVRLVASQGPQARYTAWLRVLRGHVRCVVGTRAAAFAPVRDLGLAAVWDDGDDLLAEPRAPYPHAREVIALRARQEGAALLLAGYARTASVQLLVEQEGVRSVAPAAVGLRRTAARRLVSGELEETRDGPAARAHLPPLAWRVAHEALAAGPVLVQVPRRGYLPSLACAECRTPARCGTCCGPLRRSAAQADPECGWCGRRVSGFACRACGGGTLRANVIGARRTAEEIGRAFPGTTVRTSGGGETVGPVGREPALVVATPGAEPQARDGYAATLLLDAWALLDRPGLDAAQEALRRWLGAAALTRSEGTVVLCGAPTHARLTAVEALSRWDPVWFARRELADRQALDLPPAVTMARLLGSRAELKDALDGVEMPASADVIGPIPYLGDPPAREGGPRLQVLIRAPRAEVAALTRAMARLRAGQSARKAVAPVHVQIDPPDLA